MHADEVIAGVRADDVVDRVGIALNGPDPVGNPGLGGAPTQGRQRIRTGVNDGDVMAVLGQRDSQATGTSTEVEDPQRTSQRGGLPSSGLGHGCPHRGRAQGAGGA